MKTKSLNPKFTNEQWFSSLSTKEKAKWLAKQGTEDKIIQELRTKDWEEWLKEEHHEPKRYQGIFTEEIIISSPKEAACILKKFCTFYCKKNIENRFICMKKNDIMCKFVKLKIINDWLSNNTKTKTIQNLRKEES